jgi:voltage-gated potassium channel
MEFTLNFIQLFLLDIFYASPVLLFLIALICTIGLIIAKIEGWSSFDGIYHAFINATTVGYGDIRPTRAPAKLLAIALAIIGLIFSGMIVAVALHAADFGFAEVYNTDRLLDRFAD